MSTKKLYLKLLKEAEEKANTDKSLLKLKGISAFSTWRKKDEDQTYSFIINSECKNKEDIIRIASMAYAWMPTMLNIYADSNHDWKETIRLINNFKKNKLDERELLIENLSKIINNSIVGTSKFLHIINPELAPMIDSRVSRYWNLFFNNDVSLKMPSDWNFNIKNHQKKIIKYIRYWDYLNEWKVNLQDVSIRDLEVLFYYLGEKNQQKTNSSLIN
jgi:hypothetical protein